MSPMEQLKAFLVWGCLLMNMVAFIWLVFKINHYWPHYDKWVRNYKIVLAMYSFAVTFLTGEVIVRELNTDGFRYIILDATAVVLLYSLATNHHHPAGRPFNQPWDRRNGD
jgi:hypothetical protein